MAQLKGLMEVGTMPIMEMVGMGRMKPIMEMVGEVGTMPIMEMAAVGLEMGLEMGTLLIMEMGTLPIMEMAAMGLEMGMMEEDSQMPHGVVVDGNMEKAGNKGGHKNGKGKGKKGKGKGKGKHGRGGRGRNNQKGKGDAGDTGKGWSAPKPWWAHGKKSDKAHGSQQSTEGQVADAWGGRYVDGGYLYNGVLFPYGQGRQRPRKRGSGQGPELLRAEAMRDLARATRVAIERRQ
eukprot:s6530_g1.t1